MESITKWLHPAILHSFPEVDLSPLPGKPRGKLKLTPEALLAAIHGPTLAEWALREAQRFQLARLPKGPGGRPSCYRDSSILLMAVVQTLWCKSYEAIVDQVMQTHLAFMFTSVPAALEARKVKCKEGFVLERAFGNSAEP